MKDVRFIKVKSPTGHEAFHATHTIMPPRTRLHDALEFTTVAATTIRNISTGVKVPFLAGAATLTLSIVEVIKVCNSTPCTLDPRLTLSKSLKSSNEEYTEVTEQIHEILAAIIVLYETTQIRGVVPPALLSDVVNFTEYVGQSFIS
jgi:hypothetical protein